MNDEKVEIPEDIADSLIFAEKKTDIVLNTELLNMQLEHAEQINSPDAEEVAKLSMLEATKLDTIVESFKSKKNFKSANKVVNNEINKAKPAKQVEHMTQLNTKIIPLYFIDQVNNPVKKLINCQFNGKYAKYAMFANDDCNAYKITTGNNDNITNIGTGDTIGSGTNSYKSDSGSDMNNIDNNKESLSINGYDNLELYSNI